MLQVRRKYPPDLIDGHTKWVKTGGKRVRGFEAGVPALDPIVLPVGDKEGAIRRKRHHHWLSQSAQVVAAASDRPQDLSAGCQHDDAVAASVGQEQVAAQVDSQAVQSIRPLRLQAERGEQPAARVETEDTRRATIDDEEVVALNSDTGRFRERRVTQLRAPFAEQVAGRVEAHHGVALGIGDHQVAARFDSHEGQFAARRRAGAYAHQQVGADSSHAWQRAAVTAATTARPRQRQLDARNADENCQQRKQRDHTYEPPHPRHLHIA